MVYLQFRVFREALRRGFLDDCNLFAGWFRSMFRTKCRGNISLNPTYPPLLLTPLRGPSQEAPDLLDTFERQPERNEKGTLMSFAGNWRQPGGFMDKSCKGISRQFIGLIGLFKLFDGFLKRFSTFFFRVVFYAFTANKSPKMPPKYPQTPPKHPPTHPNKYVLHDVQRFFVIVFPYSLFSCFFHRKAFTNIRRSKSRGA